MKLKRTIKLALLVASAIAIILISISPASAQCAMCRNALSGSPSAAKLSKSFNFAVLVLLIPPVMIFCGIFLAAFKFRKAPGEAQAEEHEKKGLLHGWLDRLRVRRHPKSRKQEERAKRGALA